MQKYVNKFFNKHRLVKPDNYWNRNSGSNSRCRLFVVGLVRKKVAFRLIEIKYSKRFIPDI